MTGSPDPAALYEAKALAELGDADALAGVTGGGWSGDPLGDVALVVGAPAGGEGAVSGLWSHELEEAVGKALTALGFGADSTFLIASRPEGARADGLVPRLQLALEAVDAPLALALDAQAADDLAASFGLERLHAGVPVRASGRILGYTGDFEDSLGDDRAKGRVWAAMKAVAAAAGHRTRARRP